MTKLILLTYIKQKIHYLKNKLVFYTYIQNRKDIFMKKNIILISLFMFSLFSTNSFASDDDKQYVNLEIYNITSYKLKFIDFDLKKPLAIKKDKKIEFKDDLAPTANNKPYTDKLEIDGYIARVQVRYNKEGLKLDETKTYPCYFNLNKNMDNTSKIILKVYENSVEITKVINEKK